MTVRPLPKVEVLEPSVHVLLAFTIHGAVYIHDCKLPGAALEKLSSMEDRRQTDRATTLTRAGLRRTSRRASAQLTT